MVLSSPPSSLLLIYLRSHGPTVVPAPLPFAFFCAPGLSLWILFPFSGSPLFPWWVELNLAILGLPRISPIQAGSTEAYLLGYLSFWQGEENLTGRLQPSKKLAPHCVIYHVANELDSTAFSTLPMTKMHLAGLIIYTLF